MSDRDTKRSQEVSFRDYEHAVLRYRDRMAEIGLPLINFRYDEDRELYDWEVADKADGHADAEASEAELRPTDMRWQHHVEAKRAPRAAEQRELRRVEVIDCMRQAGATVSDELTYFEVVRRASREFPGCLDAAVRRHPV